MAAIALSAPFLEQLPDEQAREIIGSALAKLPSGTAADGARRILDDT
jgi:hypothetical protein